MYNVVISGTGLYTPASSISNDELVESFNTYVHRFNSENAAAIEAGEVQPGERIGEDPGVVLAHHGGGDSGTDPEAERGRGRVAGGGGRGGGGGR